MATNKSASALSALCTSFFMLSSTSDALSNKRNISFLVAASSISNLDTKPSLASNSVFKLFGSPAFSSITYLVEAFASSILSASVLHLASKYTIVDLFTISLSDAPFSRYLILVSIFEMVLFCFSSMENDSH